MTNLFVNPLKLVLMHCLILTGLGTAFAGGGPVLSFTGNNSYVNIGAPAALQIPSNDPFTVEGWMYLNALSTRDMLYCKNNARSSPYTYMLGFIDSGRMAAFNGSAWIQPSPAAIIATGQWLHIAFSFDGSSITFYLDGENMGSAAFSFVNNAAHTIKIGGYTAVSDSNAMKSDVRVWDHARTQAQIQDNMHHRLIGDETGLLGYWPLSEGAGAIASDSTANASNGDIINASWVVDADLPLDFILARPADNITDSTATLNGWLADYAGETSAVWACWDTTDHGTNGAWGNTEFLGDDLPAGGFSNSIAGLTPDTLYYYTFFATNSMGTSKAELSEQFKTLGIPGVTATAASDTLKYSATLHGALTNGGGAGVWFEWWQADSSEINTNECGWITEGPVSTAVSGLDPGSNYFYRICASNMAGTALSEPIAFNTPENASYYVSLAGDNSVGASWTTAFNSLQTAIDAAEEGDTIYLKGETFTLTAPNPSTGKLFWGAGKNDLTIEGGYTGTSPEPGSLTNTPTILLNTETGNRDTNRVMYVSSVTNGVLRNLTIQGGHTGNANAQSGIGGSWYGAGIYMTNCENILLDGVTFIANRNSGQQSQATYGAGLYAITSSGVITNCVFKNNTASGIWTTHYGIGMNLSDGAWTVRDCIVRDNTPIDNLSYDNRPRGAGIYINNGTHTVKNCAITRNTANGKFSNVRGEALTVENGTVIAENLTVYWHTNSGIERMNGSLTLTDSLVWDNGDDIVGAVTLLNNNIKDGDSLGVDGNISADPGFERGLFLATNSPCVDAGSRSVDDAGLTGYSTRADGAPDTATVNIGYHFPPGTVVSDYYVDAVGGSDADTGLTPESAFKTITRALLTIGPGGHIHLADGLYDLANGEVFPITVANHYGVQLIGADAGTTILRAPGADNLRVMNLDFVYPDARIENITIRDGWIKAQNATGAGMNVKHSRGMIVSCLVTNNIFPDTGSWGKQKGAIYVTESMMTISNCVVRNNRVVSGYADSSYAAGIYLANGGTVLNCIIIDNQSIPGAGSASHNNTRAIGGGIYINGDTTIRNSLIARNEARDGYQPSVGDGVYVANGIVLLENCTILDNLGEGVNAYGGTVNIRNSILRSNTVDVTGTLAVSYSNIEIGTYTDEGGNISDDPLFIDAPNGDFRLLAAKGVISPSINAGTNQPWMNDAFDLVGEPRIHNRIVDMGAYETWVPPAITLITTW